jgi:hypothetical protein
MKVVFCTPSLSGPTRPYVKALEDSIPLIVGAGWEEGLSMELGNPYISAARSHMTRKALDAKADVIVYIDYDLSWKPQDLLTLIETPGDVVAGTYRFKKDEEEYMGCVETDAAHQPLGRADGCLSAINVPAGFLKVTKEGIDKFMGAYPELVYGPRYNPSIDLFNHGAFGRVWFGEDFSFCRRWREMGERIWLVPDLDIDHYAGDIAFKGNFHKYLQGEKT